MTKPPKNIGASVRAKLLAISRSEGQELQLLMMRFANERLLYRLAESSYASRFVLKGATLFTAWLGQPHRATRDIDLLGYGDEDEAGLRETFQAIVALTYNDGVEFGSRIVSSPIREDQQYGGVRLSIQASVGGAKLSLQVDVGFGDAITPRPSVIELPALLDFPSPKLAAYPRETVVAEKLEAIVQLGLTNTRMKDFYDLATLADTFSFDGTTLTQALTATFARRQTPLPTSLPDGLTPAFSLAPVTQLQWQAFHKKAKLPLTATLFEVAEAIARFTAEPLAAAAANVPFDKQWLAGGPWRALS